MHVTCVFSTIGVQNVQNVIRNDRWSVTTITSKKAEHMERPQKTEDCHSIAFEILGTVRLLSVMS